jgi:CheY-like chemotaxis protein
MNSHSQKILFAEDEELIRQIVTVLLKRRGFRVIAARDGREALQIYQREKPDLLLSDVNMPNMGGFELLDKIREKDKRLPAILVSADPQDRTFDRDPYVDFLPKPFDYQILCSRIENALAS